MDQRGDERSSFTYLELGGELFPGWLWAWEIIAGEPVRVVVIEGDGAMVAYDVVEMPAHLRGSACADSSEVLIPQEIGMGHRTLIVQEEFEAMWQRAVVQEAQELEDVIVHDAPLWMDRAEGVAYLRAPGLGLVEEMPCYFEGTDWAVSCAVSLAFPGIIPGMRMMVNSEGLVPIVRRVERRGPDAESGILKRPRESVLSLEDVMNELDVLGVAHESDGRDRLAWLIPGDELSADHPGWRYARDVTRKFSHGR